MASNKALDSSTNDIFLVNGQLALVAGADQTRQLVSNRLRHFYGNWFLNTSSGVTYFQEIFTRPVNLPRAELLLIQEINDTNGVSELLSFNVAYDSSLRALIVGFEATTDAGTLLEQEGVAINE